MPSVCSLEMVSSMAGRTWLSENGCDGLLGNSTTRYTTSVFFGVVMATLCDVIVCDCDVTIVDCEVFSTTVPQSNVVRTINALVLHMIGNW